VRKSSDVNRPWRSVKVLVIAALVTAVLGSLAIPKTASAAAPTTVPSTISFQGKIVNFTDGTNVADGTYAVKFRLYNALSGGTQVWGESQASVSVIGGVFQVNLGSTCSFFVTQTCGSFSNTAIDFSSGPSLYLTIQFAADSQETSPRIPLQSVPFAFNAETANQLGGRTASQFIQLTPGSQQTGSINISGANSVINDSGTGNTTIGGATGSIAIGGTNTTALTILNGSSAALSLQSGNAINLTAAAASSLNFGSGNTLSITSSTLNLAPTTGVLTLGGTTPTLTGTNNTALLIQSQGTGQLTLGTGSTGILGLGTSVTTLQSTLTAVSVDLNNASPATLTLKNSNAAGGSVLNLNLLDGALQTNSVTRLDNAGNLSNIGTIGAGGGTFNVDATGNQTATFTNQNTATTANGSSGLGTSTSLVVTSATGYVIGNYVGVADAGTCTLTGVCYAKITNIAGSTLTITPALKWSTGAAVNQYKIPEIGGADTTQTLTSRYGKGYFIAGVATGNGTTNYTEDGITSTLSAYNLLNTNVTTLNIGGAATTISIGKSGTTTTIAGALQTSSGGNIATTGALQGGTLSINGGAFAVSSGGVITAGTIAGSQVTGALANSNFNSATTYSNITAVGTLTSLTLSGAITGATTINGNTFTSSALTFSGASANTITGTASQSLTVSSGASGQLILNSANGTLGLSAATTTIQRNSTGSLALDLNDAGTTSLILKNSGSGVANLNLFGGSLTTGSSPVTRIDNSGNVTANTLNLTAGSNQILVGGTAVTTFTCGANTYVNTAVVTAGLITGHSACSGTGLSDQRLKTDITPFDNNVLDKLQNVATYGFNYDCTNSYFDDHNITCDTRHQSGVIAQQLMQTFPDLVYTDDYGYYHVDYQGLSAYTLKGVSTLAQHIDSTGNASLNVVNASHVTTQLVDSPHITSSGALQIDSGSTGDLNIDSGSETASVNLGTLNASDISIGRSSKATTVKGSLNVEEGAAISGNVNLSFSASESLNIASKFSDSTNLETALKIDNPNVSSQVGSAIKITNSGGAGYSSIISSPDFTVSGTGDVVAASITGKGAFNIVDSSSHQVASIDTSGNANFTGNLNAHDATLTGNLSVAGDSNFAGLSTFQKLATFIGKTIFRQDVQFDGHITVAKDSAGYAKLRTGETTVHVKFTNEYDVTPIVSAAISNGQFAQSAVNNVDTKGFDIALPVAATADITFSWTAVGASDPQTATNPLPTP
jgi:hypothetical protein